MLGGSSYRIYTNAFSDYSSEIILVGINYDKETKEHGYSIEMFVK